MLDWTAIPVTDEPLTAFTWPDHDLQAEHLTAPEQRRPIDLLPVHAEQLVDGSLYVHDGRHRILRALARGDVTIQARVHEHR